MYGDEYRESPAPHPGSAERLHEYWVHGEGAAKIGWGAPGDFDRCVALVIEHAHFTPGQAKGYCNLAHHAATGTWPAQHAKALGKGAGKRDLPGGFMDEIRAQMSSGAINDLPDSAFAYIEPGGKKDASGKTTPRSLRHFPIHDEAHVRNALSRAPQSPFGAKAMPKIRAAARKFGIQMSDAGQRSLDDGKKDESMTAVAAERRYTMLPVEMRAAGDAPRIGGYAAVFNKFSRNLGGFVEVTTPSFFNKSRGDGWPEVRARYDHKDEFLLGTTAAGTLSLRVDGVGLDYDVVPPHSRADVVELVERGDVRKSSFAFRCLNGGDDWGLSEQGYPLRSLVSGQLIDVAPLGMQEAYVDTSASMRSLAERFDAGLEEVRSLAESDELRRFFVRTDAGARVTTKKSTFGPSAKLALLARRKDWE
jgi:HK97 family phage prohead protease